MSPLQIEHLPYLVQPELVDLVKELKVAITAYSSFGPQFCLELPPVFRERAKSILLLWDVEPVKQAAERVSLGLR